VVCEPTAKAKAQVGEELRGKVNLIYKSNAKQK
jgi:hypothetical protein